MSTEAENLFAADDRLVSASDPGARVTTDHSEAIGLKVLMLVPQRLADDRNEAVRKGVRPQADYDALAAALRDAPGGKADILDLNSLERNRHWLIRLVQRLAGPYWALAVLGHLRCQEYDAVFSHSEIVGLPFALMAALPGPRHVMTAYYLTGKRNAFWYRGLRVHRRIDAILTQAREQDETGRKALRLPDDKLVHVDACGYIDSKFFAATPVTAVQEQQLCSAGREYRDYETLIKAMADLPKVTLKVDPASPWSLHSDELAGVKLPPNVEVCRMEIGAVCRLYAESAAVVIPLHPNAIGAGTTTLVEAMSMGKPVIITQSKDGSFAGRADLEDGHNVILVEPHDVAGLRNAIERLMRDRDLRARIGANARHWAERHAGREQWLGIMLCALRGSPATERSRP
jgi:glycosyltransferase involved in cell wall biosynthesis